MKAMNEANVKINPKHDAKKQALEFVKELKKVIPIDRAKMRLKISFAQAGQQERMQELIKAEHTAECEIERATEQMMQLQIQPHMFRELSNYVKEDKQTFAGVSIEIVD